MPKSPTPTAPKEEIRQLQLRLGHLADRRPSHLTNLAFAGLKYLILNAESDNLRMRAIELVLLLEPVKQKLHTLTSPRHRKQSADEDLAQLAKEIAAADPATQRSLIEQLERDQENQGKLLNAKLGDGSTE